MRSWRGGRRPVIIDWWVLTANDSRLGEPKYCCDRENNHLLVQGLDASKALGEYLDVRCSTVSRCGGVEYLGAIDVDCGGQ